MNTPNASVIIRIGTHAEKTYLEKLVDYFDGFIFGANLVESTPSATASLIMKYALSRRGSALPYFIDPMTYAFGSYIDPNNNQPRNDLDWIKSEQKQKGELVRDYKKSYYRLANRYGELFSKALSSGIAIKEKDLFHFGTRAIVTSVLDYQLNRIREEFLVDPEYQAYAEDLPNVTALFAPYFYVDPKLTSFTFDGMLKLAAESAAIGNQAEVHIVICASQDFLYETDLVNRLGDAIPDTGVKAAWLWFSKFSEHEADPVRLKNLRRLTENLSKKVTVYNMHGGYFSLALSKYGMKGISHGIGYGEQKDVVPVVGKGTPTVNYYLPRLRRKVSPDKIQYLFDNLGVETADSFYKAVCDCPICRGIITQGRAQFQDFTDRHYATADSKRLAQTPAAAKRCRFHYLINRLRERDQIRKGSLEEVLSDLEKNSDSPLPAESRHLRAWFEALK